MPTVIFLTDQLPKTGSGKIQRRKMVEVFAPGGKPPAEGPKPPIGALPGLIVAQGSPTREN